MAGNPAMVKGASINPYGHNGRNTAGHRAKTKAERALDKAIDLLGKDTIHNNGVTRLSELMAEAMEKDIVVALKAFSGLFPKQVNVDVQHSTNPLLMSDEQLLSIIESRQDKPKVINELPVEANKVDD